MPFSGLTGNDHIVSSQWRWRLLFSSVQTDKGFIVWLCLALKWSCMFHSYNLDAGFCALNRECKGRPSHFVPLYKTGKNSLSIAAEFNQKEVLQWEKSNKKNVWWEKRNPRSIEKFYCVCISLCFRECVSGVYGRKHYFYRHYVSGLEEAHLWAFQKQLFNGTVPTDPVYDSLKSPPAFKCSFYEH